MQEKNVIINNISVNYKVFGDVDAANPLPKKPFLVLHGWPSSSDKWQKVGELLNQKNITVIAPDLPGFGKTPAPSQAWSLNNYVEFINEFANHVPELSKGFYLLGHSFGGALSAKFAIKYNQKVEKLFLVSAACIRQKTKAKKGFYYVAKIGKLFSFLPYYSLLRKAFYKFIIRKSDYSHVNEALKQTYLNVIADDLSQFLSSIKVPTVIIWGDKDASTPMEDAHFINKKIPHSKLVIINKAGHPLEIEVPEVLSEKIVENA